MRYNDFDMLPIRAFQSLGGKMTLEGGGGGYDYAPAVPAPQPPAPPPPVILIPLAYVSSPAVFTFSVTGLRPNSRHYFYFNRALDNANVIPLGGSMGGALVTDSSGSITFRYVYRALAGQPYDNEQSYYAAAALAIGNKQCVLGDVSVAAIDSNPSTTFMSYGICTVCCVSNALPATIPQQGVTAAQAATYVTMPYNNYNFGQSGG